MSYGLREAWQTSTIGRSASVLTRGDRRKIALVMCVQMLLGIFDLIGVALIGILGALAITGVSSGSQIDKVESFLQFLSIDDWSIQMQVSLLGALATVFLVGRTIISIILTRRVLYFLSFRGASITTTLVSRLLSRDVSFINKNSKQETLFALTYGVNSITLSVLGVTVTMVSDIALLLILSIGLLIADPFIAVSTVAIFGGLGFGLYRFMNEKAKKLGEIQSVMNVASANQILDTLNLFREISLKNNFPIYVKEIEKFRRNLASSTAELTLMPSISKYFLETAVVISALGIAAVQFLRLDAIQAIASLSIFMAAGSRIAPAVLRIQQGAVQIKGSLGAATPTLNLIESLNSFEVPSEPNHSQLDESVDFTPSIIVEDLTYVYKGASVPSLKNINLKIEAGAFVALVGPSGGGKTTLVDCILGVLETNDKGVLISGLRPSECKRIFPGKMSYVPQDIFLTSDSISKNVSLEMDNELVIEKDVWTALEASQIAEYVRSLPYGIHSAVGENGSQLSGGQKQRIGIARALYSKPALLVLDEATSAMDGQTEFDISSAINALRGETTVVMIAHRLSTVKDADLVVYLNEGRIVASGSFAELKNKVPDFEMQARLLGL